MADYLLGITLAISAGIVNNIGSVFQKTGVNKIPIDQRKSKDFQKQLMKLPIWWLGILLAMIIGTVFFMVAQLALGLALAPALVPGLMAAGLIFLAIGSAKINKESLTKSEILGIALMIVGITCIGISGSSNTPETIVFTNDLLTRIAVYTIAVFIFFFTTKYFANKRIKSSGILYSLSSGSCYSLSNFWVAPVMTVMDPIFSGLGTPIDFIMLAISSIILIYVNLVGITTLQKGFTYGQASNLIPIQQVPIQITPILIYFFVFDLISTPLNILFILIGVGLIIYSSFLLGKRQAQMEQIK